MVQLAQTEKNKALTPELERDFQRNSELGYEPEGTFGYIRCLSHGAPNPLIRWHFHEEYELHLILETSGKMFVGDYIGRFTPGNLVLTGPRLPHNWISADIPEGGVAERDLAMQFTAEPIQAASELIPELRDALPLLERAKHGIEFDNITQEAHDSMRKIQESTGLERFSEFIHLLSTLANHSEYRLLSSVQMQSFDDDATLHKISEVVDYISEHYATPFTMAEIAENFHMNESRFSRYFRRATGNTFTDFVNRLRINRSCQLLMETDQYISTICYKVGYNNVANFNRRFMEVKGMTPSEFRRQGAARFGG